MHCSSVGIANGLPVRSVISFGQQLCPMLGLASNTTVALSSFSNVLYTPMYNFSTFQFTNASATGSLGPTYAQTQAAYGTGGWWTSNAYFNVASGLQRWTVPVTGTYSVTVAGAGNTVTGVNGTKYLLHNSYGAVFTDTAYLSKNQVLSICVGQKGMQYNISRGGGHGGTFVYSMTTSNLLFAAGGGGGSAGDYTNPTGGAGTSNSPWTQSDGCGVAASLKTYGTNAKEAYFGIGGTGGSGGGAQTQGYGGTGGGGYSGNGLVNTAHANSGVYAASFLNGAVGANAGVGQGGFGGGGHAGTSGGWGAGGGGGYSGGGGGANLGNGAGGGGGGSYSFNSSNGNPYSGAATNSNDGYVTVSYIGP